MFTLKELIENPKAREDMDRFYERNAPRCCICKKPFTEAQKQEEDIHQTKKGLACGDCYYTALGELIERHPIVSPSVRRG